MQFKIAKAPSQFETGKKLFKSYVQELGIDLSFQDFELELDQLNQQYNIPTGALILVSTDEQQAIGCCGVRRLEEQVCELKRMYLDPRFRKKGLASQLLQQSIQISIELGYHKMRLDTLASMERAIQLYTKHGFYEIEPYRFNPLEGARYFEIDFTKMVNL